MNRSYIGAAGVSLLVLMSGCSAPAKPGCESDNQCRDGRICVDGACQAPGDLNNGELNNGELNNGELNNGESNNGDNNLNNNNGSNNENNMAFVPEELCAAVCDRLFGSCVEESCDVGPAERGLLDALTNQCIYEGFEGEPGCLEAVEQDPDAWLELEQFLAVNGCDSPELEAFRCNELNFDLQCGCDPSQFSNVGNSCDNDFECDGELPGFCVQDSDGQEFPDGYCVTLGCPAGPDPTPQPVCGEGNFCVDNPDGGGICVDGCLASSDCRDGYQCRLIGGSLNGPSRICIPECEDDSQCGGDERCADGTCQLQCTEGTANDPGGREICLALGFECSPDDAGIEWCVMP